MEQKESNSGCRCNYALTGNFILVWDMDRLAFVKIIGMQFLDFFDFLTNSVMMPIAALDDKSY